MAGLFVGLLIVWLMMQKALSGSPAADPNNRDQVMHGEAVYRQACAACHGASLEGQPNWKRRLPDGTMPAPPHDDTGHTWHHPDQLLFDYTKFGGAGIVPAPFKSAMPAFGDALTDDDIWAVLAFIKSSWSPRMREVQQQRNVQQ